MYNAVMVCIDHQLEKIKNHLGNQYLSMSGGGDLLDEVN